MLYFDVSKVTCMAGWIEINEIPVRHIPVHAVVSFFISVLYMHCG